MKKGMRLLVWSGIVLFAVFFAQTLFQFISMKAKNDSLKTEIDLLKRENEQLRVRMKTLYNDSNFVDEVARQQIGLVKDGETVYVIAGEKKKH